MGIWARQSGGTRPSSPSQPRETALILAILSMPLLATPSNLSAQVLDLACVVTGGPTVEIVWSNPVVYDSIEIQVDGVPAATLPGNTVVASVAIDLGIHEICVLPSIAGTPEPAACCLVAAPDVSVATTPDSTIGQAADPLNPNPVVSDIVVTDALLIGDLQVRVEIAHTFRGDLEVRLTSPAGITLTLANNDGGAADDIRTTFFDGGASYDGGALGDRTWLMPEGPGTLGDYAGASSSGTWSLTVDDTFAGLDDGVLEEWELSVFAGTVGFPIDDVSCQVSATEPGRVSVSWTNPSPYDSVDVEIDGLSVATLPGDATSFLTDPESGLTAICVRPTIGGSALAPTCCALDVGIPPVTGLQCAAIAGADVVTIEWSNAATYYDSIAVEVDGVPAQLLGGDAESTTWPIDPLQQLSICIRPSTAGEVAPPTCCTIAAPIDTTDASVIVAAEFIDGFVDSATALETALVALGEPVVVLPEVDASTIGTPRAVWVMLGTFPQNHSLSRDEGQLLVNLVMAGIPVYLEGGDAWGFDDPTPFSAVDGIANGAADGDDTFQGMIGLDHSDARFAGLASAYGNDAGTGNDWIDQLSVTAADSLGPNAGEVWIDDGSGGSPAAYATGVYYDTTPPAGRVLCQSWEFGGYGGDAAELAQRYRIALGLVATPTLRRGDSNGDGAIDIGDTVFLLDALFTFGNFPSCSDAADVNDDGAIDVSDAVFTLSYSFSGGPPPPAPGPTHCGEDPTVDGLGCAGGC